MDNNTIESLLEALKYSPDNLPLKFHLADSLLKLKRYDEAEIQFIELIRLSNSNQYKFGLAQTYFAKKEFSKALVILEDVLDTEEHFDSLILLSKILLEENSIQKAQHYYQRALDINPEYKDEVLDSNLRLGNFDLNLDDDDDDFDDDDSNFKQTLSSNQFLQISDINFNDVGGMEQVKKEIDLKIIKPLVHQDLYRSYGKKIGGGILLYGPPGCGKTFIAKATAGQIQSKFFTVGLNDILDMWIGNSEKNLHGIFEIARQNKPCVLFFDEIDALGASRSDMKQSSSRHLINQFLQELDGINSDNEGILIIGATNTPWNLDTAFRRPGRFDRIVFIPPPDEKAKEAILKIKLENKPIDAIDYQSLSKKLEHFSGADIEALIDIAIEAKLEESFIDGIPKPLTTKDLLNAASKHKPSTQEWFNTAKNYALYANETGLYDEILKFLKIKK
ncbi:AAA family ATPase [Flavobacterium sp. GCM10027622]|uniref:AAA family ATPase n=1 Tax=unclassified Flavobacterium TaxID=196869 RepID=UPI0036220B16